MNIQTKKVHPANLRVGDTILINGDMKTVGKHMVKTSFFGTTVDGYRVLEVDQVFFAKWNKDVITGYYAQV